ncbi:MAG: hypothetical protein COT91_01200 [Candidatus Doudnabacteria bacterium CG10_big_fil_rev_8_21_14_0_10_41_10]|uniref:Lipid/polyisoprenoid-binding YceI-like domain-containing protein n=1 Tax=Candidatus Doudnabacteria bacterium CG10_big_fil_rev_8_21_14_0_10_41_10 TaxID=1974551 RepID=A0A2H0VGK2_9BACT|nr:MAG: hypothetical protein COT91_01200 [Candidatus Doudnabacteria bacterium CG10_big_fil_rev_8_21_14_0_10_41_10]
MNKIAGIVIAIIIVIAGGLLILNFNSSTVDDNSMMGGESDPTEKLPTDAQFTLDAESSTLTWSASRIVGESHTGTVDIARGRVVRQDGEFIGGEFVFDMNTISESKDNQIFLKDVKSDDFFGVEQFPTADLVITSIVPASDSSFAVTGELTIRGITNEISFTADTSFSKGILLAEANFEINRTRWGIVFDSGTFFANLGDEAIKDEIQYELDLVFTQN